MLLMIAMSIRLVNKADNALSQNISKNWIKQILPTPRSQGHRVAHLRRLKAMPGVPKAGKEMAG